MNQLLSLVPVLPSLAKIYNISFVYRLNNNILFYLLISFIYNKNFFYLYVIKIYYYEVYGFNTYLMDSHVIFLQKIFTAQIWAWASNTGGYDVEAMVKATKGTSSLNPETRDKTIQYLVAQMDRLLGYRRPHSNKV